MIRALAEVKKIPGARALQITVRGNKDVSSPLLKLPALERAHPSVAKPSLTDSCAKFSLKDLRQYSTLVTKSSEVRQWSQFNLSGDIAVYKPNTDFGRFPKLASTQRFSCFSFLLKVLFTNMDDATTLLLRKLF